MTSTGATGVLSTDELDRLFAMESATVSADVVGMPTDLAHEADAPAVVDLESADGASLFLDESPEPDGPVNGTRRAGSETDWYMQFASEEPAARIAAAPSAEHGPSTFASETAGRTEGGVSLREELFRQSVESDPGRTGMARVLAATLVLMLGAALVFVFTR